MTEHEQKISRIRSTTLGAAGLTSEGRNNLVRRLLAQQNLDAASKQALASLAESYTIGDAIDMLTEAKESCPDGLGAQLLEMGMTYFDWDGLPPETATELLSTRTKEQLLGLDVRVLGTFSHKALRIIGEKFLGKDPGIGSIPRFTIGELVANVSFPRLANSSYGTFAQSFFKTKTKLEELGFGYEDGLFFQDGTARKMAEDLAIKYGFKFSRAQDIVGIAWQEGWIKPPLK